ncbi:hypothetical protein HY484_01345, partial [Candidatus Woesearchaeota archaeon]|nr:hypothetical protein [Candidatus Woesearchaeota archaeon]
GYKPLLGKVFHFEYDLPEYCENYFKDRIEIVKSSQVLLLENAVDYDNDKEEFARDMIRKRRNNDILYKAKWSSDYSLTSCSDQSLVAAYS